MPTLSTGAGFKKWPTPSQLVQLKGEERMADLDRPSCPKCGTSLNGEQHKRALLWMSLSHGYQPSVPRYTCPTCGYVGPPLNPR